MLSAGGRRRGAGRRHAAGSPAAGDAARPHPARSLGRGHPASTVPPPAGSWLPSSGPGSAAGAGAINQRRKSVRPCRARLVAGWGRLTVGPCFGGNSFTMSFIGSASVRTTQALPIHGQTQPESGRSAAPLRAGAATTAAEAPGRSRPRSLLVSKAGRVPRPVYSPCCRRSPGSHRCKPIRAL